MSVKISWVDPYSLEIKIGKDWNWRELKSAKRIAITQLRLASVESTCLYDVHPHNLIINAKEAGNAHEIKEHVSFDDDYHEEQPPKTPNRKARRSKQSQGESNDDAHKISIPEDILTDSDWITTLDIFAFVGRNKNLEGAFRKIASTFSEWDSYYHVEDTNDVIELINRDAGKDSLFNPNSVALNAAYENR